VTLISGVVWISCSSGTVSVARLGAGASFSSTSSFGLFYKIKQNAQLRYAYLIRRKFGADLI